jgi:8-oxo-dGTP diphosphatase
MYVVGVPVGSAAAPDSDYPRLVSGIVRAIDPCDEREARDRADTLAWVASGATLCRTAKPATPPEHLVSYIAAVDRAEGQVLLVDHRLSGLWLPAGGHVEPGEHPADTARREMDEELGIAAPMLGDRDAPWMVTRTPTVGPDRHVDVSLWYAFAVPTSTELAWDRREFHGVRWWPYDTIRHGDGTRFDPELPRFVAKVAREAAGQPDGLV